MPPLRRPFPAAERACYVVGLVLIAAGVFHFGVFLVKGGSWEGPVSWRKPTTFGLSFGLTLISVTWVTSFLRLGDRTRTVLLGILAADCVVEVGGISLQAWRHVPSHFNTETPEDARVAMTLAAGGAVLVAVLGTLAAIAFRGRIDGPPDLRLALRAGFALLCIGLGTGVAMIVKGTVLVRQGEPEIAYDTAGSLKLVHAVTLHGILVLPVIAVLLALVGWPAPRRLRVVRVAIVAYALATVAAFVLSLVG